MPNARVGAMPQPQREISGDSHHGHQSNGGRNRHRRQQGISMQDLKQQTALRLAQEQQQRRLEAADDDTAEGDFDEDVESGEVKPKYAGDEVKQNDLEPRLLQMSSKPYSEPQQFPNERVASVENFASLHVEAPFLSKPASFVRSEHSDISSLGEEGTSSEVADGGVSEPADEGTGRCRGTFSMMGGRGRNPRGSPPGTSSKMFFPSFPSIYRQGQNSSNSAAKGSRKKEERKRHGRESGTGHDGQLHVESHPVESRKALGAVSDYSTDAVALDTLHPADGKPYFRTLSAPAPTGGGSAFHSVHGGHAQNHRSSSRQSKLPHGLTVQELKEMTKARLAAEASETKEHEGRQRSQFLLMQPSNLSLDQSPSRTPIGLGASHVGGESFSRDRVSRPHPQFPLSRQRINSVESAASAPPIVLHSSSSSSTSASLYRANSAQFIEDCYLGATPQGAYVKGVPSSDGVVGGFQGTLGVQPASFSQVPPHMQHPGNKWNNHEGDRNPLPPASSGFRSEFSAFTAATPRASLPANGSMDEHAAMLFGRSRSYPDAGPSLDQQVHISPKVVAAAQFEPAGGIVQASNRRRTWTTSPRLGHLWEDHPVSVSVKPDEELMKRSFTGGAESDLPIGLSGSFRSLDPASSPHGSRVSTPTSTRFSASSGIIGDNCRRHSIQDSTSGGVAPRFVAAGDGNATESALMMGLNKEKDDLASMLAELPNSVAESVLGSFNDGRLDGAEKVEEAPVKSTGLTGVFRSWWGAPGGRAQSSKTVTKESNGQLGLPSSVPEDTDLSSSTWGTSQPSEGTNCATVGLFSDDLNRLLKRGDVYEEEDVDRLGPALVSRIDPEVHSPGTPLFGVELLSSGTPAPATEANEVILSVELVNDKGSGLTLNRDSSRGPQSLNVIDVMGSEIMNHGDVSNDKAENGEGKGEPNECQSSNETPSSLFPSFPALKLSGGSKKGGQTKRKGGNRRRKGKGEKNEH